MKTANYADLIGKRVTITFRKYKHVDEITGTIIDLGGCCMLIQQDNGERIWVPKLGKRDSMTTDEKKETEPWWRGC